MKNIFILSLFSLLFLAVRCPKSVSDNPSSRTTLPPEVLPPATQTGANTFGCLLNGKVWLPEGVADPARINDISVQYYRGEFTMSAIRKMDTSFVGISWQYRSIYKPGVYHFNGNQATSASFTYINSNYSYVTASGDSSQNYFSITKFDSINRIISGTFNLLFIAKTSDTLHITNGRFDAKYEY